MGLEEDLRVLSIVQKCTGWLEQVPTRLQTEGIFRVSGSAKGMETLLGKLEQEAATGRVAVDLDAENIHTVAGVLKRALIKIEPSLVPARTFDQLLASLELPPRKMIEEVRTGIKLLADQRLDLLRHILQFLRKAVREHKENRMDASNLCKVFAASLLRHPDDMKTALSLGCGRLPKVAAVLLLSDAVLDRGFDPIALGECSSAQVVAVVSKQLQLLDESNGPKFGSVDRVDRQLPETAQRASLPHSASRSSDWLDEGPATGCAAPGDVDERVGRGWLGGIGAMLPTVRMPRLMSGFLGLQLPWEDQDLAVSSQARRSDANADWRAGVGSMHVQRSNSGTPIIDQRARNLQSGCEDWHTLTDADAAYTGVDSIGEDAQHNWLAGSPRDSPPTSAGEYV